MKLIYGRHYRCGLTIAITLLLTACTVGSHTEPKDHNQQAIKTVTNRTSSRPYVLSGTLLAVGDIMMHSPQFPAYYNEVTGLYDFTSFFTQVKPILEKADWCWANMETPSLGGGVYKGYPLFDAPPELPDALKDAGFNIVTVANNHALDQGEAGVLRTLEVLKERQLVTKGIAASSQQAQQPTIVEKKGIQLGVLAYTYGTNGIPLPKDKPYLVSLIDEQQIRQDIQNTLAAGADVVVIALHWGNEYEPNPNEAQIQLAHKLIQSGAHIIIGSHPHVPQPHQRVIIEDKKKGTRRDGIIMYSQGNFISNQTGNGKDIGVISEVKIHKHMPEGRIELGEIKTIPTWVHIDGKPGKRLYRVLPLEETIQTHADNRLSDKDYETMKKMLLQTSSHLSSMGSIPVSLPALLPK